MGGVAFVSCFVHDGDEHGTAFTLSRVLLGTFKLLVLRLSRRKQAIRAGTYRELAFLATMCSNTVLIS